MKIYVQRHSFPSKLGLALTRFNSHMYEWACTTEYIKKSKVSKVNQGEHKVLKWSSLCLSTVVEIEYKTTYTDSL